MQTTRWARCSSTSSRPSRNFEVDLLRMRTREGMAITRANGKAQGKQPNSTPASERTLLSLHQAGHTRSRKSQNSSPSGEPPSIERSLARAVVPPRSLHESAIFGRLARSCERRARPPRRHAPLQLVKHDSVNGRWRPRDASQSRPTGSTPTGGCSGHWAGGGAAPSMASGGTEHSPPDEVRPDDRHLVAAPREQLFRLDGQRDLSGGHLVLELGRG
jgi:hypothetical protein